MKSCNICHTTKPLSEFGFDKNSPGGRNKKCLVCAREYCRNQRIKNPDGHKKSDAKRRKQRTAWSREWRVNNKESVLAALKRYESKPENKEKGTRMAAAVKKKAVPRSNGKHPGGRPPLISEAITTKLVAALQHGAYIETASAYAGIAKDTLYAWLKRGARARAHAVDVGTSTLDMAGIPAEDVEYVKFSDAIIKAVADSEMIDLETISRAASAGQWQAAAWRLERKNAKRWGRQSEENNELKNINIFNTLNIDVGKLSDDQLDKRVAQLLQIAGVTYEHETLLIDGPGQTIPGKKDSG